MLNNLVQGVLQKERQYRANLEDKILQSSLDLNDLNSLPKLGVARIYLKTRHEAWCWAIRSGQMWIPDSCNVAMVLALRSGDTFFDIGANIGWQTWLGSWLVGQHGSVHSFEPSPTTVRYLRRRVVLLSLQNTVVNEFALGSAPGTATLYEYSEGLGATASLRPGSWPGYQHTTETTVEVKALDDYVDENQVSSIRLMKIDVEGAEIDVLRGAAHLLSSAQRPVLVVEVLSDTNAAFGRSVDELLDTITDFGYRILSWRGEGLVDVRSESDVPTGKIDNVICLDMEFDSHVSLYRQLLKLSERRKSRLARLIFGKNK